MDTYTARVLERIDDGPGRGSWERARVGVFRATDGGEEQVGEYMRDFPSLLDTFHPFTLEGRTYALYSPRYTETRVMELPSCRDLGGEEPVVGPEFYPAEYYVPSYVVHEYVHPEGKLGRRRFNDPAPADRVSRTFRIPLWDAERGENLSEETRTRIAVPHTSYPFGFVAGFDLGNDNSHSIQYLDLSGAASGRIRRDARFGYAVLPKWMRLRDAVDMRDYLDDDDYKIIGITIKQRYELDSGAVAERWD